MFLDFASQMPCKLQNGLEFVERHSWHDMAALVEKLNPRIAQIINELGIDDDFSLYKVRYPFGQKLLDKGVLQLPTPDGQFLPVHHEKINPQLQKDLHYIKGMPVGLVLNRELEMFISINNRTTPFSMMSPGKIFGLWAVLDPNISCERGNMWNITAGARSIFMLPKLTDGASHKRLQRMCGILAPAPKGLLDHWEVFKELVNFRSVSEKECWYTEVLYFSRQWVERQSEALWQELRLFFYQCSWEATASWRNQFIYDIEFYTALENHNLKPDPYLVDTARHMLGISVCTQTGFGVACNDNAAPVSFLQKVYTDVYNLPYAPTLMLPTYIRNANQQPVYYSLHHPTIGGFSPKGRKLASKKYNLKEIKYILQKMLEEFLHNRFELGESPVSLHNITQNVNYRYFHSELDQFGEIEQAAQIVNLDHVLNSHLNNYPEHDFCDTSSFLCGVIQLSHSK